MNAADRIRFCSIEELRDKKIITKWVNEWRDEISALFVQEDDSISVFSSICPHFGGEIELFQNPPQLRCKWHDWRFDIKTGNCLSEVMPTSLRRYSFQENNGFLEINLS